MSLNNYTSVPRSFLDASVDEKYFFIDPEYLTDVIVTYSWGEEKNNSTTSNVDHPSFTALRNMLERTGHISMERRWWNGDRVLKNFSLNGSPFSIGDKFPCGGAMRYIIKRGKENDR